MLTFEVADKTLQLLWNNYYILSSQVDLELMGPDRLDECIAKNVLVQPFRFSAWIARQSYFLPAWSLWEFYARTVCIILPKKEKRLTSESCVTWVGKSFRSNGKVFSDEDWFNAANSLRNIFVHHAGNVLEPDAKKLLLRANKAFSKIDTYHDGYVRLEHEHIADLHLKIEDFLRSEPIK